MISVLLLMGVLSADAPPAGVGEIIATAERTVAAARLPSGSAAQAPIPLGAYRWPAAFDPADRAPYAFDWKALLADDEKIADIERITMSASGASLGVEVDESEGRAPIIATDGKAVQFWFLVDPAFQENAAFLGSGVEVGLAVLIRTDAVPFKMFERTAVLTVRQQ